MAVKLTKQRLDELLKSDSGHPDDHIPGTEPKSQRSPANQNIVFGKLSMGGESSDSDGSEGAKRGGGMRNQVVRGGRSGRRGESGVGEWNELSAGIRDQLNRLQGPQDNFGNGMEDTFFQMHNPNPNESLMNDTQSTFNIFGP